MTRLAEAVDAYEHTARALLALGRDCGDEDFALPTECPGWTVQDQFSHVAGVEDWMLTGELPDHQLPEGLAHVTSPMAAFVEVPVDLRRSRSGKEVVVELADLLVARLTQLRSPDADPAAPTRSPIGDMPLLGSLALRTMDIWVHEQDVRRALGRPGNLGSPAAHVAVHYLRRALPRVVGRAAGLPVGTVVDVEVSGPVAFRDVVQVQGGEDGKTVGAVLDGAVPDGAVLDGAVLGRVDARIVLDTEAYMCRAAGRWPADDTPAEVSGDVGVAKAVLATMAVTP